MKRDYLISWVLAMAAVAFSATAVAASESEAGEQSVSWWTPPGETDGTAFSALILVFLLLLGVFHLYARFDRFAERHNEGTPLKTTIPMLLMIAFAYEIFPPLSHFSILLPLSLIVTALARDLMLWFEPAKEHALKGEIDDILLEELHHRHASGEQQSATAPAAPETEPDPPSAETKAKQRGATDND